MPSTVLITGASRGIGAAAARLFAQKGWQVAANYCQSEREARALAASHPGILAVQADVADRGQVDRMTKEVLHQFGHIDVLINNAGIAQQKLFTDVTETEWERLFCVNVTGVFHCCQAVMPGRIRRQRGKILNLSSIWGMTGASCEVAYSAAKAAVIGLSKALAKEVGPSGITVNCVAPGVIDTQMNASLDDETRAGLREETPLGVLGKPEDVANLLFFLASEQADFITGQVLGVDGGGSLGGRS